MKTPEFDSDGCDNHTFAPFTLYNALDSEWKDVRLSFSEWDWMEKVYDADTIDDYYLNGYGVEGLVKAVLLTNGIDIEDSGIHWNSEGDTCYVHFQDMNLAIRVAELASEMIADGHKLREAIKVARENGFED